MPKKKDFKRSAASVFFGGPPNDSAQDDTHKVEKENPVEKKLDAQYPTQDHAHEDEPRRPIRTQGRKGAGKPRINMAFEPDIYDFVRLESERLNVGMTQYVNDVLYTHMKMHTKKR